MKVKFKSGEHSHLNLFTTYAASRNEKDLDLLDADKNKRGKVELRLENDLTRALMVVLDQLINIGAQGVVEDLISGIIGKHTLKDPWITMQTGSERLAVQLKECTEVWVIGLIRNLHDFVREDNYDPEHIRRDIPDAWIVDPPLAIAFEIKAGAKLKEQQINNYVTAIKRRVPADTSIKDHIVTWGKDIAGPLEEVLNKTNLQPVGAYLIEQFVEYLRRWGMAPARFRQTDFIEWDNSIDKSVEKVLANQLAGMAEELLERLPSGYTMKREQLNRDYVGYNFWNPKLSKPAQPIPHWSLGLVRAERRLRLYITVENKNTINQLLKHRIELEKDMAESILTIDKQNKKTLSLHVVRKWFLEWHGKGIFALLYMPAWSVPLSQLTDKGKIDLAIHSALDMAECLQQEKITLPFLDPKKIKAVIGVIQLDFSLNWFELEQLGTAVWESLHPMVEIMMPFYNVLLKHMRSNRKQL